MTRVAPLLIPVAVGCESSRPDENPPDRPAPEMCAPDPANSLRAVCHVAREAPGSVEVAVTFEDGSVRTFPGDPDLLEQDVIVWDLLAEVPVEWEVREGSRTTSSGTLVGGRLPPNAQVHLEVQIDGPSVLDRILVPVHCNGAGAVLLVLDADGRVRWIEDPVLGALPTAFGQTDDGTMAVSAGRNHLYAWAADGTIVHDLAVGVQLERPIHHSLVGDDLDLLVLDATAVTLTDGITYVDEGVTRIQPDGSEERVWDLWSVLDPTGLGPPPEPITFGYWNLQFPGAVDLAHVNGVAVTDDGDWLVSMKNFDMVVRLDPAVPAVEWALVGSDRAIPWPEMHLADVGTGEHIVFEAPHTPRSSPWGTVLFMDNGLLTAESRVLEVAVDEVGGTAEIVRAWDLGASCPVHSSVHALPDGSVFAACAATGELFELDDAGIRRRVRLECDSGDGVGLLLGAQPIVY